jgi:hypothetical protein
MKAIVKRFADPQITNTDGAMVTAYYKITSLDDLIN